MQSAINMHLSQIAHGILYTYNALYEGIKAMFIVDGDNEVVVGYTPSMIKFSLLTAAGAVLARYNWYDWDLENVWDTDNGTMDDSFITLTERGFIIDGEAVVVLQGTTEQIIWEVYGCKYDSDYRVNMNPDAVAADGAMDFIQPVVDPDAVEEEEYS